MALDLSKLRRGSVVLNGGGLYHYILTSDPQELTEADEVRHGVVLTVNVSHYAGAYPADGGPHFDLIRLPGAWELVKR